jgi:hypothetical protein
MGIELIIIIIMRSIKVQENPGNINHSKYAVKMIILVIIKRGGWATGPFLKENSA